MVFQNRKNKVPTLMTQSEPRMRHFAKHFSQRPMKMNGVNFSRLNRQYLTLISVGNGSPLRRFLDPNGYRRFAVVYPNADLIS